jgi:hypothetical protein
MSRHCQAHFYKFMKINFALEESRCSLDKNVAKKHKENQKTKLLTVRVSKQTMAEYQAVAEIKRSSMSVLIHQFVVKSIGEIQKESPERFEKLVADNLAVIEIEEQQKISKTDKNFALQNKENKLESNSPESQNVSDAPNAHEDETDMSGIEGLPTVFKDPKTGKPIHGIGGKPIETKKPPDEFPPEGDNNKN